MALLSAWPLAAERYSFRAYGEREGLRNPLIRMITQDAAGYLWMVSAHGAYRFDGTRLEYMHPKGLDALEIRWIQGTPDGSVWVRSADRLLRWRDGKASQVLAGVETRAQCLGADTAGNIWLLGETGRLQRLDGKSLRLVTVYEEAAGLWSVLPTSDGSVLTGCGDGLCLWRAGVWSRLAAPPERYTRLSLGRDGTIYARGQRRIARRRPGEQKFEDITFGLPPLPGPPQQPDLTVDFQHRLLTNTETGFARLEGERWQLIGNTQGFADQVVRSLFADREGSIWLGTQNGLNRWLGDGAWRTFAETDGVPRGGLRDVAGDGRGRLWVVSLRDEVYRGEKLNGQWRFQKEAGLPPVRRLFVAGAALWLGTWTGGVQRYDPARRQLAALPGLPSGAVAQDFLIDTEGRLLVATTHGLFRETAPGVLALLLGGRPIRSLALGRAGTVWVGGEGVLGRVEGGGVRATPTDDRLEEHGIHAIHEGADGRLWLGTWKLDGLRSYRWKGDRWRFAERADGGQANTSTFFIKRDQRGRVWTGTTRGAFLHESGHWHHFGKAQGLLSDEAKNAYFDQDGSVWLATSAGLAQYVPPLEPERLEPPLLVIDQVSARFGPLPPGTSWNIGAEESDLEVEYSVLSTNLAATPAVRYRLNPREDWRVASSRSLEFLNLAPGAYRLEMAAQGLNGKWHPQPAAVAFRVLPFWWQTWWFRVSAALLAGAGVSLAWKSRLRAAAEVHLARLRAMVDNYPGVVFILNKDGRFVLANRRLEQYTRKPAGGLDGRLPREVMAPENAVNLERNHQKLLESGDLMAYREAYEVPTGRVVLDIRAFPLPGLKGEADLSCVFATDVTDRERLEQEREAANQRYEAFVSQSTEAIWRIEYEPPVPVDLPVREFADACYERGYVREANAVAASFLDVPAGSVAGRRYKDLVNRWDKEQRLADQRWYENRFRLRDFTSVRVSPTGEKRIFLANTIGIVENGCLVRTWSTQREVTEQRRMENLITNTARGVSAETGVRFFDSLVEHLARSLRADRAIAAELLPGGHRARLLAGWAGDAVAGGREFDLIAGLPALTAIASGKASVWTSSGGADNSLSPDYTDWLGDCCVAIPIAGAGAASGFMAVSWKLPAGVDPGALPVLEIFAARAGAELERLRAERDVLHYQEQLRALAARTQTLAEQDRAHLAREIHDELGQQLTAIKIGLASAGTQVKKGQPERALEQLAELGTLTDDTVRSVRRVATELRPPVLDQLGLAAAIRWQAKEFGQRLNIPVACELENVRVGHDVAITGFRILQESLTNVMRHANARRVEIRLEDHVEYVHLTVKDDGIGFEPRPGAGGSLGLLGMHERANAVGGRVTIESAPGQGTTVMAVLPVSGQHPEGD